MNIINELNEVKRQVAKLQANQKKGRVKKMPLLLSSGSCVYYERDPLRRIDDVIDEVESVYLRLIDKLSKKAKVQIPKKKSR